MNCSVEFLSILLIICLCVALFYNGLREGGLSVSGKWRGEEFGRSQSIPEDQTDDFDQENTEQQ